MSGESRTVEQKISGLAKRQHGVVTRAQLLAAGVTTAEIEWRVGIGMLIAVHRGVYRVGHEAPSTDARYLAAVLACGEGAVLMGLPAAHLLGLIKGGPPAPEVLTFTERRIEDVATRRSRRALDPRDWRRWRGIRVTNVPRTLVDLAATLSFDDLAKACHEAGVRHRTTPRHVEAALARKRNAQGAAKLPPILRGDARVTLSKLERQFLRLLREHGLPLPITNKPAGSYRVDCRWPAYKLTVELDSYRFHNSRRSWQQGYRREREARARGDDFARYTWGDVFEEPGPMLAELGRFLAGCPA